MIHQSDRKDNQVGIMSVTNENKEFFLMGDLNCDFLKKEPSHKSYVCIHGYVYLNQLVTKATRSY